MRSDKDEIARLRAEVISLQEKILSYKSISDRVGDTNSSAASLPDYSSIDFSLLTKQMASLIAENALLLKKIECINTLKIKVAELESANVQLIDRINRSEYGFFDQQQHGSIDESTNIDQVP